MRGHNDWGGGRSVWRLAVTLELRVDSGALGVTVTVSRLEGAPLLSLSVAFWVSANCFPTQLARGSGGPGNPAH